MFVVAGVSGNTGKVVAESLLSQKKQVRVVVRDAQKGEAWKAKGAEVAVASIEDSGALTKALLGAEGVYALLPPPGYQAAGILDGHAKRAASWAKALGEARVPHVVFLSSIAAQHPDGTGAIVSAHRGEQELDRLGVARTFVRAAYFMENWGGQIGAALSQGVLPTSIEIDRKLPMVATHDIGLVAAKALVEGPKGRRVIELAGPEEYSPNDTAALLSSLTGKPVTAINVPVEAALPAMVGMGLSKELAQLLLEIQVGVNNGRVAFEGKGAEAVRGSTPLRSVLEALVSAAR